MLCSSVLSKSSFGGSGMQCNPEVDECHYQIWWGRWTNVLSTFPTKFGSVSRAALSSNDSQRPGIQVLSVLDKWTSVTTSPAKVWRGSGQVSLPPPPNLAEEVDKCHLPPPPELWDQQTLKVISRPASARAAGKNGCRSSSGLTPRS